VRAAWQEPERRLGLSAAETHWIAGAPIDDRYVVLYRIASILPSTLIKTALIVTVLCGDVTSVSRLAIALFLALVVLESLRMIADRAMASLSPGGRLAMRVALSGVAASVIIQFAAKMIAAAAGSVHPLALLAAFSQALGDTAGSAAIQYLAMPWRPMANLALSGDWSETTCLWLTASALVATASIALVMMVDRGATAHQSFVERKRLMDWKRRGPVHPRAVAPTARRGKSLLGLPRVGGIGPLISRQWIGVVRYRGTIFLSLTLPAALSLSPLVTSDDAGLMHVAAWLAVSTLLLAPPALRLDFRRDIERMWLLKSLPVSPLSMTLGQLLLPSLITILFQATVIAIACVRAPAAPTTIVLVAGCLSAFAVFSFALENLLFLTFPHRIKQEGLAMMVRAKLMFLGKGLLLTLLGGAFLSVVTLGTTYRLSVELLAAACIAASWTAAISTVLLTARCWGRFDTRLDSPLGI
ncbi:MAG: hypothetical protein ACO1RT_03220, partial [Planctomycetaceae bacterium]